MNLINPLKVVIVDDKPALREDVARLIRPWKEFEVVAMCGSVKEAVMIIPGAKSDLVFLDIELGDGTGFDILKLLPDLNAYVIFLTAYKEYGIQAVKFGAKDYLLKPLVDNDLKEALHKALIHVQAKSPSSMVVTQKENAQWIALSSQQRLQIVLWKNIMYCHSDGGYTTFYVQGDKKIVTSKHIKEYEDQLPAETFIRAHQSYMVNVRYIDSYDKDGYLLLHNGHKIPVATRRKEMVINVLTGN